jgi:uncharacterized protein involved in exopolysaccharide biosynthesis
VPAVTTATLVLLGAREWSAASAFVPQSRRSGGDLSGFAAQLGVAIPGQDATQSPAFYAQLVTSRELIGALVDSTFVVDGRTKRLADALEIRQEDPAVRRELTIKALEELVNAVVVQKSGIVRVTTRAPSPELALQVNRRMLDLVNRFNLDTRQSQAAAERRFVERRLADVRAETRQAEDRLQGFLRNNRDIRNSPELTLQQERLARDVALRQQVFAQLAQAYEQSRIEEVRDTPVITVVESPERPALPDSRGTVAKTLLALTSGFVLGLLLALARSNTAGGRSFDAEWQVFRRDLRRPWRLLLQEPAQTSSDSNV